MRLTALFRAFLAKLGIRDRRHDDLKRTVDEELAYHLDRRTAELIAAGASASEASRRAAQEFGDLQRAREYCAQMSARVERRQRWRRSAGDLVLDLRYAARTLARSPGFTAAAVLIMAVGIGANTAVFSVVDAVLLEPLDYPEPQRLLQVWESRQGSSQHPISPADLGDWREQSTTLDEIAGYGYQALALTGDGLPERLIGIETSDNFFDVLQVEPALGRAFSPGEEGPGSRVAVLSAALWRSRFGADPQILGRSLTLSGLPYTVIGVMPEGFAFPSLAQLWIPFTFDVAQMSRGSHFLFGIARLAPDASLDDARAETATIAARLAESYPGTNTNHGIGLVPLQEQLVGDTGRALWVVFGAVALVLLIACGNVANMLLVRAAGRTGEISIRKALGAGSWRLARQLLVESVLLSSIAGVLGLALAAWSVRALVAASPVSLVRGAQVGLDAPMLLFALAVSLLTGVGFGAGPVLQLAREGGRNGLLEGGSAQTTSGRGARLLRDALVVVEVALTLVLLFAAGLLIGNLSALRGVDPGFRPDHVLTARLALPQESYGTPAGRVAFMNHLLEQLATLPGVESFGTVDSLPFSGSRTSTSFDIEGDVDDPEEPRTSDRREVTPGYFRTMGIPLLRGREIRRDDGIDAAGVAVVNEAFARRFFPGGEAIGRRIRIGSREEEETYGDGIWREIVGVVGNLIHDDLTAQAAPELYTPYWQHSSTRVAIAVRTRGEPGDAADMLRAAVLDVDPNQPLYDVASMEERLERFLAMPRANAWVLAVFSIAALALAVLGVAGVVSYAVTRRTHELGIRVALGARAADVVRLVLRQGMAPVGIGLLVGLAGSLAAARYIQSLLFQVAATDPRALLLPAALLAAVSLLACLLPARRALRVDPIEALRAD